MKSAWAGSGIDGLVKAADRVERRLGKPVAERREDGRPVGRPSGRGERVVRLLGVDPGGVTGVSVFWVWRKNFKIAAWAETLLAHDEHVQVHNLLELTRLLSDCGPTVVVCEGFRVRMVSQEESFLSPVRIGSQFEWGVLERNVSVDGVKPWWSAPVAFWWVPPSEMAGMDDTRLKRLGYFTPGPKHRRDATRHNLLHWKAARAGTRKWPTLTEPENNPLSAWDPPKKTVGNFTALRK